MISACGLVLMNVTVGGTIPHCSMLKCLWGIYFQGRIWCAEIIFAMRCSTFCCERVTYLPESVSRHKQMKKIPPYFKCFRKYGSRLKHFTSGSGIFVYLYAKDPISILKVQFSSISKGTIVSDPVANHTFRILWTLILVMGMLETLSSTSKMGRLRCRIESNWGRWRTFNCCGSTVVRLEVSDFFTSWCFVTPCFPHHCLIYCIEHHVENSCKNRTSLAYLPAT